MLKWNLFGRNRRSNKDNWNIRTMFGPNLNFASAEAYKLLRTNITFSFSDEGEGHVFGITSSIQGEGKSSTACNVAYALAESGKKVLLMEGDLRKPTVGSKLGVMKTPGLTNLLVGRGDYREMIQKCPVAPKIDIMTSGDIPPNPSELLSSHRMEMLIAQLRKVYDFIVMDLPPVNVVSDAVAVSKLLDGVVMVVRSGVSDQKMLSESLRQLEMVNVRILGFVYRDSNELGSAYGYHKYGKKYYRYYSEYEKTK